MRRKGGLIVAHNFLHLGADRPNRVVRATAPTSVRPLTRRWKLNKTTQCPSDVVSPPKHLTAAMRPDDAVNRRCLPAKLAS